MNAWLHSILTVKCPRCHEDKMFPEGTLYHPTKFAKMKKKCSSCGQSFEPEPGYYFGAMFISYGINTAYFVAIWVLFTLLFDEVSTFTTVATLSLVILGLLPITFRVSRVLWINIFVRFRGDSKDLALK